jgi:hypothetical protein
MRRRCWCSPPVIVTPSLLCSRPVIVPPLLLCSRPVIVPPLEQSAPRSSAVVPTLSNLIELRGTHSAPVTGVSLLGLTMTDNRPTFFEPRGNPSGATSTATTQRMLLPLHGNDDSESTHCYHCIHTAHVAKRLALLGNPRATAWLLFSLTMAARCGLQVAIGRSSEWAPWWYQPEIEPPSLLSRGDGAHC